MQRKDQVYNEASNTGNFNHKIAKNAHRYA